MGTYRGIPDSQLLIKILEMKQVGSKMVRSEHCKIIQDIQEKMQQSVSTVKLPNHVTCLWCLKRAASTVFF